MNLNYIKTFFYTVKLGSLTNAAAYLDITQPAATRQIQELQGAFEITLFDKTGKKMILTDVGKVLYEIAGKIIDLENEIDKSIKDYKNQKIGNIKITSIEGFGNYYLSEIIYLFSRMFPEISITIDFEDNDNISEKILSMSYDIGFTNKPLLDDNIEMTQIIDDYFFLIVKPDSELSDLLYFSPENIADKNFILLNSNSIDRTILESYFLKNNINVNMVCEVGSYFSLKNYVKNGMGIAIVPKNIVNEEINSGTLTAIPEKDKSIYNTFYFVKHKDKYFNKSLNVFREIVIKWSNFYSKGLLDSSHWDSLVI